MGTGTTDTDIIKLVLNGDSQAFAQLVERHQSFVFTIVLRYVKGREDAEEVAQDVFVKAYRSLADFNGTSKFSTWLYTIATTSSISFLRKKKLPVHSLDNEHVFSAAQAVSDGKDWVPLEQKSRIAMVNEAIRMLPPDDAAVLTLFYKGEQSLEEMALILGKERNTVKVQLHRARARLKEKLEKYFAPELNDMY